MILTQHLQDFGLRAVRRPLALLGVSTALLLTTALYGCAPAETETAPAAETVTQNQTAPSETTKRTAENAKQSGEEEGQTLVSTQDEFKDAVKSLEAGDTIVLANGRWENFEILFKGKGTEDAPIRLRGETPGGVILTGQSNLRLAGEYLEVSDLVFKDGSEEVVAGDLTLVR